MTPSAQAAAAARTAATAATDAERVRLTKAEKAAAQKLKQKEEKAAKKLVADAKKAAGGAGGAGGGGAGGGGKGKGPACYDFVRDGSCARGDGCRFSHDPAVCDAATAAPAGISNMWGLKWKERTNPQRGSDPAARVHGSKKVFFTGILAKDRWEICEQTAHKCFKRHVECNARCKCALCSKPHGKKWPEMVDEDLMPSGHPDKG